MWHDQIQAQGFAIIPGVFSLEQIEALKRDLEAAALERSRAGARHALGNASVAAIANSDELLAIVHEVLGPGARPFRATLFDKSPTANWLVVWHQDTALPIQERSELFGWGPWSVKAGMIYAHAPAKALEQVLALRVHLDDSNHDNGPLRVLPGTHSMGVLTDEAIEQMSSQFVHVDCVVEAGGVVAMHPLIVHASSKSSSEAPRRVLHIEYAARLDIDGHLQLAVA